MRAMAEADLEGAQTALDQIRDELRQHVLPPDQHAQLNAIVEISMGVGGSEGGIFAGDLLAMYTAWARRRRWSVQMVDVNDNGGLGGYKRASLQIDGHGAYGALRREAGVHRVQRVPATESAGRVHTSTAAVLVMPSDPNPRPEAELFSPKDVKEEVMRAGGAGGQHVNKTESAVRLTHVPTGISVSMQDSRSQHENRRLAYIVLNARLLDRRLQEQIKERKASRLAQVSGTDRSDKIRTYNYQQDRVTDHRVPVSVSNLEDLVAGGQTLDDLMELLESADEEDRLDAVASEA